MILNVYNFGRLISVLTSFSARHCDCLQLAAFNQNSNQMDYNYKLEGARASTGLTLCVDVSSGESYK